MPQIDSTIRASFRKPFAEQVAAFRLRLGDLVPTTRWDDIERSAHDRAFMVAGAAKADLLADLAAAVDRSIAEGTGLEAFKRDFRGIVEGHGWHGWTGEGTRAGENWRMRVIYRTNMAVSYMAGRHAQLREGNYRYWVYHHGGSLEPRVQHLAWDGLILPADHAFWNAHYPPNGWGCSCDVSGARSMAAAKRRGGDPSVKLKPGWDRNQPRTGAPPGIDKGWDYAPGASVADTIALAADKIRAHPALLGADYGSSLSGIIDRYWPTWVADTLAGATHRPALAGTLDARLVKRLAEMERAPASAEMMVRPGLLKGPKATRHATRGDALPEAVWLTLPARLRAPQAVLLDMRTGKLLYLLSADGRAPQLAVQSDYFRKGARRGDKDVNMIVSAYRVSVQTIRDRLSSNQLQLLFGSVGEA